MACTAYLEMLRQLLRVPSYCQTHSARDGTIAITYFLYIHSFQVQAVPWLQSIALDRDGSSNHSCMRNYNRLANLSQILTSTLQQRVIPGQWDCILYMARL